MTRGGPTERCRPPEVSSLTPQEEQLLNSLIDRLNQTSLQEKDPDAEALLKERLAGNPDSLYMLAQTVLVQNIALDQARAQMNQLQQQLQQHPAHTTSFLGRLLGDRDEQTQPMQQSAPASLQQASAPGYQQVPSQYASQGTQYPYPPYGGQQYAPAGQSSFLSGALQTAAGVAAGALVFEGVESILHGLGRGFGYGGYGWGGPGIGGFGMGERPVEVINNYYDEPGRAAEHSEHHAADPGGQFGDSGYDPRNNDPNDNLRGFDDQNALSGNEQDLSAADNVSDFADQANFDDQNVDDGSGFADSGGFDDGGGGF